MFYRTDEKQNEDITMMTSLDRLVTAADDIGYAPWVGTHISIQKQSVRSCGYLQMKNRWRICVSVWLLRWPGVMTEYWKQLILNRLCLLDICRRFHASVWPWRCPSDDRAMTALASARLSNPGTYEVSKWCQLFSPSKVIKTSTLTISIKRPSQYVLWILNSILIFLVVV